MGNKITQMSIDQNKSDTHWTKILKNWEYGIYFKYPLNIKNRFMWNTSVIKENGKSKFKENFKESDKLPKTQNWSVFSSYINKSKNKYVTSFLNLNKDTLLVIPMPQNGKNYATLKDFCDNASKTQQIIFWQEVSKLIKKKIIENKKPIWVSTHGLGVPYMHVRISNSPKYYFDKNLAKNKILYNNNI